MNSSIWLNTVLQDISHRLWRRMFKDQQRDALSKSLVLEAAAQQETSVNGGACNAMLLWNMGTPTSMSTANVAEVCTITLTLSAIAVAMDQDSTGTTILTYSIS